MKRIPTRTLIAYAITASAILLTAWKGTLDWMGLLAVALIFKMPGSKWFREVFGRKHDCTRMDQD